MVQAAGRQKEIVIRVALGASRLRIVRQLLTENLLLFITGGTLGLIFGFWSVDLLKAFVGTELPRAQEIGLHTATFVFALIVSLLTGIVFGVIPALQFSKPLLNESLKEGGRGLSGSWRGSHLQRMLVISEVSIALVLLIGAG